MAIPLHPRLCAAEDVAAGLLWVSQRVARAAARQVRSSRVPRNTTPRPGPASPLWNALVLAVRPHLRRRGEKTNLGRELGVPPQRIHEYFVARTAFPDAERTLRILLWLAAHRAPAAARKP